jgi:hypothetical protein
MVNGCGVSKKRSAPMRRSCCGRCSSRSRMAERTKMRGLNYKRNQARWSSNFGIRKKVHGALPKGWQQGGHAH